jgi:hypothetical protein
MRPQRLALSFFLIEIALWPSNALALPACPGQTFYLKSGEALEIEFNRRPGCDVRFFNVERGAVERRLFYSSGKTDDRMLSARERDTAEAWSELPQKAYVKARADTVIKFLAQAPTAPAQEKAPQEVCPGMTLQLSPGQEVSVRLGKRRGCNVGWSTYEGTVEEFIIYPSGKTDRRTISPTTGEFRYQETPSALRIKAFTPASLKFLAQRPVPSQTQPPQLAPQVQAPRPAPAPPKRATELPQFNSEMISKEMAERLLALVVGAVFIGLLMLLGKSSILVIGHWSKLIENLQASPKEFYTSVEQGIERRQVPSISNSRVDWKEGGLFTAWREYLRINREKEVIDICGAPYGSGFFVSWWHGELQPSAIGPTLLAIGLVFILDTIFAQFGSPMRLIGTVIGSILIFLFVGILINRSAGQNWVIYVLAIPVIGWLMDRLFLPPTYYRIDSASMFRSAIEQAVHEVIDQMAQAKGLRALTELEKKPILRDFFQRLR